jgi:hypothetical protein
MELVSDQVKKLRKAITEVAQEVKEVVTEVVETVTIASGFGERGNNNPAPQPITPQSDTPFKEKILSDSIHINGNSLRVTFPDGVTENDGNNQRLLQADCYTFAKANLKEEPALIQESCKKNNLEKIFLFKDSFQSFCPGSDAPLNIVMHNILPILYTFSLAKAYLDYLDIFNPRVPCAVHEIKNFAPNEVLFTQVLDIEKESRLQKGSQLAR